MSTATSGRAREHKVRDHLTHRGWETIARSAGSRGPADLIMAHEDHGLALIQVGTGRKALGPADRARLLRAAWLCSALPILAQVVPDPGKATIIRFWVISNESAGHWTPWEPDPTPRDADSGRPVPPLTA